MSTIAHLSENMKIVKLIAALAFCAAAVALLIIKLKERDKHDKDQ